MEKSKPLEEFAYYSQLHSPSRELRLLIESEIFPFSLLSFLVFNIYFYLIFFFLLKYHTMEMQNRQKRADTVG